MDDNLLGQQRPSQADLVRKDASRVEVFLRFLLILFVLVGGGIVTILLIHRVYDGMSVRQLLSQLWSTAVAVFVVSAVFAGIRALLHSPSTKRGEDA